MLSKYVGRGGFRLRIDGIGDATPENIHVAPGTLKALGLANDDDTDPRCARWPRGRRRGRGPSTRAACLLALGPDGRREWKAMVEDVVAAEAPSRGESHARSRFARDCFFLRGDASPGRVDGVMARRWRHGGYPRDERRRGRRGRARAVTPSPRRARGDRATAKTRRWRATLPTAPSSSPRADARNELKAARGAQTRSSARRWTTSGRGAASATAPSTGGVARRWRRGVRDPHRAPSSWRRAMAWLQSDGGDVAPCKTTTTHRWRFPTRAAPPASSLLKGARAHVRRAENISALCWWRIHQRTVR